MKRILTLTICWLVMFGAIAAGSESLEVDHHYKLFLNKGDSEEYICMCTMCDEWCVVYPSLHTVELPEAEEPCSHIFRKGNDVIRSSVEPTGEMFHEFANWYKCVCERCGKAFEAYVTDERYYEHVLAESGDTHINGKYKHLYVYCCEVCDKLIYELMNCFQYEDGTCERSHTR